MTLPVKVGGGALTFATISGLSGLGSSYLNNKVINNTQQGTAISTLIDNKFDYILLSTKETEDSSYWTINWNNYKEDNKDAAPNGDKFKLEGWIEGDKQNLNLIDQLKEKCTELSNSTVYDGGKALYADVTKYCARGVTIKDEVDKLKLNTLSVENSGGSDYSTWTKRADARNRLQKELQTLNVTQPDNAYKIIEACKDIVTTNKQNDKYKDILDAYKKVCTK